MIVTAPGRAALEAWCEVVAERIEGWYIAFDLDAIDAGEGLAVAMPEPDGIELKYAMAAVGIIARTAPVVGFGATAAQFDGNGDPNATVAAIARLAGVALGSS
jgi:arginase family enzyme